MAHDLEVDEALAGATLAKVAREALGLPWSKARDLVRSGRAEVDGERVVDPALRVDAGARVTLRPDAPRLRPGVLDDDRVLHLDRDVIVVRKPTGTLTVPWDDSDKDTLSDQVGALLKRRGGRGRRGRSTRDPFVGVVQRLDKETSGALVFARNMTAKRGLEAQLRDHTVHRRYLALVHGSFAAPRRFDTHLLRDRGDGLRGSWGVFRRPQGPRPPRGSKRSITHARPVERLRGATLVECRLETGRQHQIRIHLAEAGHPVLGERVYVRDFDGPKVDAPRVMLHAAELGFAHPRTGEEVRFRDPVPADFEAVLARLRPTTDTKR